MNEENNNIYFNIKDEEILKLCANGDIYVRGKLTTNDIQVVDGLRDFLEGNKVQEVVE